MNGFRTKEKTSEFARKTDDAARTVRFGSNLRQNARRLEEQHKHHDGVADVVHAVQQLADRAVGKRQLKIEYAVAQRNDGARREINDREHENGLLRSVWKISTQLAAMDSRIEMHDVSVAPSAPVF